MKIKDSVILVTGANRGIGKALVEAGLKQGAAKIYATARKLEELPDFADARVVPVKLDITDRSQIKKVAELAQDVQLLINNAGVLAFASVLNGPMEMLMRDMEVNYYGTLSMIRAFFPAVVRNRGGIACISSIVGMASMAGIGGYSASKAALNSAVQAIRAELRTQPVEVFGIYPGPIDTDMARPFEIPKTSAAETADNILSAIDAGEEDIFPDVMSAQSGQLWKINPKALERQFASM